MAAGVSLPNPPAAQPSPDAETREKGLKALRLELGEHSNASDRALLLHEIARHHERRDDLAAAARDELAATKEVAGFVEPLESLIDIAIRSRSKANLAKLLERLGKLNTQVDDKTRTALCLATTQVASGELGQARSTLELGLEEETTSQVLWLALETIAGLQGDTDLLLKTALGRAAHARNTQLRCLLLERVARLQFDQGDTASAFETLKQSASELPSFRVLCAWEQLALLANDYSEAALAASQIATIISAGLDEPEERLLYEVPEAELNEQRAAAAQIRAVVYCLKSEDRAGALLHAERLLEATPESSPSALPERGFALALCAALQKDQQRLEDFTKTLRELLNNDGWTADESGYLATLCALACARIESNEARSELSARVVELLPSSRFAFIETWRKVEEGNSLDDLLGLIQSWRETSHGAESLALRLAECLLYTASDRHQEARSSVSEENAEVKAACETSREFRTLKLALERTIAETTADRTRERSILLELHGLLRSEKDREGLRAELLRLELLEGIHESHPEELRADTPWSNLLLGLVCARSSGDIARDADTAVKNAINTLFGATRFNSSPFSARNASAQEGGDEDQHWRTALQALRIFFGTRLDQLGEAAQGDRAEKGGESESLPQPEQNAPFASEEPPAQDLSSGVLAGVRLGEALADCDEPNLQEIALSIRDEELRSAWLLRALLQHVAHSEVSEALQLLDEHPELGDVDTESLFTWLSYRQAAGDPKQTRLLLQNSELAVEDRTLDQICLERRFGDRAQLELPPSDASPAHLLLCALEAATQAPELLHDSSLLTDLFSESTSRSLQLARTFSSDSSSELLAVAESWASTDTSATKLLTLLLAARKAGDAQASAGSLFRLAELCGSDALLIHIDGRLLPPDEEQHRQTRLHEIASAADNSTVSPTAVVQATWALVEESSGAPAVSKARLASLLDPKLKDPDAQLAQLSAGFEYLCEEKFEEAVGAFEPLLEELGADLTYCHGLRVAAEKSGRFDLEARATSELARHAPDNLTSSAYWERAGIIYQDHLANQSQAEECFNAALARTPGSPTAFERVYRFARARKDRQRQVELIDARLDTAESETLRIELYWEKARFCRMLGKRAAASRALAELLTLAPDHLPSLALAAELQLVEADSNAAVESLARIARHPDTPDVERRRAGLFAADLFEQQNRPRDAVELLQDLEGMGIISSAGLLRKARSHARSGDWGEAYNAFATLNDEQDTLGARLESAKMMLAIQRDHLRQSDELKDAVRRVLRDDPEDADAVSIVLQLQFPSDERRRLLDPARETSRQLLLKHPLNPDEIVRFNELSRDSGDETLERIALGVLGLTGRLTQENAERMARLHARLPRHPSAPFTRADIETSLAPELWGATGEFISLIAPYIAARIEPNLQALGVSPMMRVDEFSDNSLRHSTEAWIGALGLGDFELYIGGHDPTSIRAIASELPTVVIGKQVELPLGPLDNARLVAQLYGLVSSAPVLLNQAVDLTQEWLAAARLLADPQAPPSGDRAIDEKIRLLSDIMPRATRERITELQSDLTRAGVDIRHAPMALMHAGARAATIAYGEPSVLRKIPQLLPEDEGKRTHMVGEVIRFALSDEYLQLRRKAGLEGA